MNNDLNIKSKHTSGTINFVIEAISLSILLTIKNLIPYIILKIQTNEIWNIWL